MTLLLFLCASALHAVGHAAMALVASGLAVGLARTWGGEGHTAAAAPLVPLAGDALVLSAIGLAAVFVKGAAGVWATYVQRRVAAEVGNELRLELLDALLGVHRSRLPGHPDQAQRSNGAKRHGRGGAASSPTASAISALTDRIRDVELGLQQGLLGALRAVAQLLPLAVVLFGLSQRLASVGLLVLASFGMALGRVRAGYRRASARVADERERLLEAADECVRHADLWVTFGAERKARESVRRLGEALGHGAATLEARASWLSAANEVLAAASLVAALGVARAGWLGSAEQGGALLAFAVAFFMAYRPLRELAEARLSWARGCEAYDAVQRAVGARQDEVAAGAPLASLASRPFVPSLPKWQPGALEIRALRIARGFRSALSFRVEAGQVLAVCGATGAGKTTLLRTLLGLDAALEGEVLFDGVPLPQAAGPRARPFAWVPQDAPLLTDTLAANVTLGAAAEHDGVDFVAQALSAVGAEKLAAALGTGERLGGGGRAVSGGERQWIALARAVATEQPVLLLDEPTSGMDAESQRRVLDAIARLRGRRTVILVTHRPEPLAIADAVVHLGPEDAVGQAA